MRVSFGGDQVDPIAVLNMAGQYGCFELPRRRMIQPRRGEPDKYELDHHHPATGAERRHVARHDAVKTSGDLQWGFGHFFVGGDIQPSVTGISGNAGLTDADAVYLQVRIRC
jgi:hypothetical protein